MLFNPDWKPAEPTEVKPLEPWREFLLAVADEIERRGWCQKEYMDSDGRVCAVGGFRAVTGFRAVEDGVAYNVAMAKFGKYIECPDNIPIWNDMPGRTGAEVIAALRACARRG